jgi:hypothetical protein
MFTHLFLLSALFNLLVAYAAQSAIVALQSRITSPYSITSAYLYPSYTPPTGTSSPSYGKYISILSFLYQCAMILMNTSLVGAIWIYTNHVHHNGTGIREPGFLSWVWNTLWMLAILALGFASWAVGLARRGSGRGAFAYSSLVSGNYIVRTLYVVYLVAVIAASTSVTLEAFLCWLGVKKNGIVGVSLPPFPFHTLTPFEDILRQAELLALQESPLSHRLHRYTDCLGAQCLLRRANRHHIPRRNALVTYSQPSPCLPLHRLYRAGRSGYLGAVVDGHWCFWRQG